MFSNILLSRWLESLEVFTKKEFKTFLLLILNTFKRSIFIFAKKFWWLFLLLFLNNYFFGGVNIFLKTNYLGLFFLVFINLLLIFFSFLIIRPSIEAKDIFYFLSYLNKFWGFLVITILLFLFPILPSFYIITLFFLDSENNLKSLVFSFINGIKFIFYYLPVCIILGVIFAVIEILIYFFVIFLLSKIYHILFINTLFSTILLSFFYLFLFLLWLLFLSTISIYYVRMKHKDFNLFF
ncbi:MAG: hypothetical protein WC436_00380 [Candidatus Babeliales bacterium]